MINKDLVGRCGLYCGACGIYRAYKDDGELLESREKYKCSSCGKPLPVYGTRGKCHHCGAKLAKKL